MSHCTVINQWINRPEGYLTISSPSGKSLMIFAKSCEHSVLPDVIRRLISRDRGRFTENVTTNDMKAILEFYLKLYPNG